MVSQIDVFPFPYFSTGQQATGEVPSATIIIDVFDGVGVKRNSRGHEVEVNFNKGNLLTAAI